MRYLKVIRSIAYLSFNDWFHQNQPECEIFLNVLDRFEMSFEAEMSMTSKTYPDQKKISQDIPVLFRKK